MVMMAMSVGLGQQIGPRFLDRSFQRPGARALGMGGAYLLATDDATAVAWNPAGLVNVNVKRFTLPIEVVGRANFDVRDILDLRDDLEKISDEIPTQINTLGDAQRVANAIRASFNRVSDFSRRTPILSGSLAPVGGLSFGNFGLSISSGLLFKVQTYTGQRDPIGLGINYTPPDTLHGVGGLVSLTSVGIAYARSLPAGLTLGAAVRRVRADFLGFRVGVSVTDANNDLIPDDADQNNDGIPDTDIVAGTLFNRVASSRFTLDVGAIWEPTVQPPMVRLRYAAVVRNVLPVRFNLPVSVDPGSTPGLPLPPNFNFRLNPEIDLGVMAKWRERTNLVLELHNVTSSNGGGISVHAGVEHWLAGDVFAVRAGYDDDRPVFGLGINLKVVRIDVAAGLKPRERLAVGVSFRF
jgi:hypothetical protein